MAQRDSKSGHVKLIERKRGPKFYAKIRANGRETMRLIGPAWLKRGRPSEGFFTRPMAEAELQKILNGSESVTTDSECHTFVNACAEWLRYLEQEKQSAVTTLRDRRSAVNARLVPFFGEDTDLLKVSTGGIDAYRVHCLVDKGLSPSTVQCDLTNLSGIFGRAKRLGWIDTNPYDDAERVKVTASGDFNVLSVAEVEAVARTSVRTEVSALIRVAAYTGLRQGEIRALRWRDVDFANATVHVRRNLPAHGDEKAPKSKMVRSVPLIDQAARALDEVSRRGYLTGPDDRVFVSSTGGPLDDGDIRDAFYEALSAAGVARVRFHDLRHTFGTLAVQVWPVTDVQGYLGHARIETTMRYVHHVPKHDAAERFSKFVARQIVVPVEEFNQASAA